MYGSVSCGHWYETTRDGLKYFSITESAHVIVSEKINTICTSRNVILCPTCTRTSTAKWKLLYIALHNNGLLSIRFVGFYHRVLVGWWKYYVTERGRLKSEKCNFLYEHMTNNRLPVSLSNYTKYKSSLMTLLMMLHVSVFTTICGKNVRVNKIIIPNARHTTKLLDQ